MQREDTLLSETNENETNLILIDFLTHGQLLANNSLFIKLKNKMEAGTRWLARGFSTNFDWVHSIGTTVESSQNDFQNNFETHAYLEFPYDVKISYNQQCILITDFLTHQLLVCDLMNYSPKAYIDAPSDFPTRMYIEKNYEKQRDALYLMCRNGSIVMLMKYDLELFLKAKSLRDDEERNSIHSSGFIWKTTNCSMQAFVVNTALKRVMGCDFGESCLKILNSENGEFLHKIQFTNVPFAIDLAKDDSVIISFSDGTIRVFKHYILEQHVSLEFIRQFGSNGKEVGEILCPTSLVIDKTSNHVIVGDSKLHRIQIFTLDGHVVKSFGSKGSGRDQFHDIKSLCLNEISGELLVCNSSGCQVQIYK